jgi:hypothetical protein
MVAEVFAGISAFKGMLDIARSFKDMNDAAARQVIAIELREQILTAQETQATLRERINTLEAEMARFDKWDIEKERYELKTIFYGTFAYVLKDNSRDTEPSHWLCANCFQTRAKSLLQFHSVGIANLRHNYACHACKSQITVGIVGSGEEWQDDAAQ